MKEGERSVADLRAKAAKCRFLAAQVEDQRSAESLRNLAEDYEEVADAQQERNGIVLPIAMPHALTAAQTTDGPAHRGVTGPETCALSLGGRMRESRRLSTAVRWRPGLI